MESGVDISEPVVFVAQVVADTKGARATCPGLTNDALERIRQACADWRDEKYRLRRLQNIVEELKLPGLVVVLRRGKQRPIETPPPIRVRFEPIELDETHPVLGQLVEHAVASCLDTPSIRQTSFVRRFLIRIGFPTVMLVVSVPQLISGIPRHGLLSWHTGMWGAMFALMFGVLLCARWLYSAQWFIVPGGVVVRRALFGSVGKTLRLCVPADTLLTIRREQPGWLAALVRGNTVVSRRFTEVECMALLAAWQSPLRAPRATELVDLL